MRVLVTGANGFVGRAVLLRLREIDSIAVLGSARCMPKYQHGDAPPLIIADLSDRTDWSIALNGINAVVHTAARVHVMREAAADPLDEFRRINVQGTLNLARQASLAGVSRFIFVSSVKVNGEGTELGKPFTAEDIPAPRDAYGISKLEAEHGLREIAGETAMEVVIIRPPLVYGLDVKANFATMIRWVRRGVPLPFGAIKNKRSLIGLNNLVDVIEICLTHPAAANQTFLVSDGEDLSTTELLHRIGQALERPTRLVAVPETMLRFVARLLGRKDIADRLCGTLQVNIDKTKNLLGWVPPMSVGDGLRRAVRK